MRRIGIGNLLPWAAIACFVCLGCNKPASQPEVAGDADAASHEEHDHDHDAHHDHDDEGHDHGEADHDHPQTYAEAVEKVEGLETEMREALANGDTEKADDALHEIGHVLEHVAELSKDASLSADEQDEVKKDVAELFDHFGVLDEKIHGEEEFTYDEYSEKIHAAIERLHQRAAK